MQTYAYDKLMLPKAQLNLAWMIDFGVNVYGMELGEFYALFLKSALSTKFARGDASVIEGMSGREMAYYVVDQGRNSISLSGADRYLERTPEYWAGWSLAYYQWETGMTFDSITYNRPDDKMSLGRYFYTR